MSAPEGCPAWCTHHSDHSDDPSVPACIRDLYNQHHARIQVNEFEWASVRQVARDGADAVVSLYVDTCGGFPLGVAGPLAELLAKLGREDLAAAVRDLAALVTGELAVSRH